jgi:hypothetical protein
LTRSVARKINADRIKEGFIIHSCKYEDVDAYQRIYIVYIYISGNDISHVCQASELRSTWEKSFTTKNRWHPDNCRLDNRKTVESQSAFSPLLPNCFTILQLNSVQVWFIAPCDRMAADRGAPRQLTELEDDGMVAGANLALLNQCSKADLTAALEVAIERGQVALVRHFLDYLPVHYGFVQHALVCGQLDIAFLLNQRAGHTPKYYCAGDGSSKRGPCHEDTPKIRSVMEELAIHLLSSLD